METHASRGIMIGIGVIITVVITSALFIVLGYVLDIYKNIARIDYASLMKSGDIEKYSVSRYVGGSTIDGDTITGIEMLNLLNKIISQHNMKNQDTSEVVSLEKCLNTFLDSQNVTLDTDLGFINVKCLTNGLVFENEVEGSTSYNDEMLRSNFYCALVKKSDIEQTLYFKLKE